MAADGSNGPRPYTQHRASTTFLRVPVRDWPAVRAGYKREFRAGTGASAVPQLWGVDPPWPVVAYAIRNGRHECMLMVLERFWMEPLGAISEASLRAEGCTNLAEFRRYWMSRERKRFTPTRKVFVYCVRPFTAQDEDWPGVRLLEHLYGEFMEATA